MERLPEETIKVEKAPNYRCATFLNMVSELRGQSLEGEFNQIETSRLVEGYQSEISRYTSYQNPRSKKSTSENVLGSSSRRKQKKNQKP